MGEVHITHRNSDSKQPLKQQFISMLKALEQNRQQADVVLDRQMELFSDV